MITCMKIENSNIYLKFIVKPIIFLGITLNIIIVNQCLSQNKILISDPYFKDDSSYIIIKSINIQELLLDVNSLLYTRLNMLVCQCNSKSTLNNTNSYIIYVEEKTNSELKIIVLPVHSANELDSPKLMGVFKINNTSFFIFNLREENNLITKIDRVIPLQLIINKNQLSSSILNNTNDNNFIWEEKYYSQGLYYDLFIEYCDSVNLKRNVNRNRLQGFSN